MLPPPTIFATVQKVIKCALCLRTIELSAHFSHAIVRVTPDKRSSLDMMKKMAVGIQHEVKWCVMLQDINTHSQTYIYIDCR